MDLTRLSPDEVILWEWGVFKVNATLAFTWAMMAALIVGSWLLTRRLTSGRDVSRVQMALELVVDYMRDQIREVTGDRNPNRYLAFIGSLFLFVGFAALLTIVPGFTPPTASLSTTAALALAVFLAVPAYGIAVEGVRDYAQHYLQPSIVMLPFNIIGELSRTLALAVRLFGNMMSGTKIVAVLVAVVPFIFPIVFRALGLLTGMIQAYIFAVLALVYIASGMRTQAERSTFDSERKAD